jgi:CBS domain-containing protein
MLTVNAVMLSGSDLPTITDQTVLAALPTLTAKGCGCLLVVSQHDATQLLGVFTDGDLRRAVQVRAQAAVAAWVVCLFVVLLTYEVQGDVLTE